MNNEEYLEMYNQLIKESNNGYDYWTTDLYNKAYEIVKDRLFPVVVPSYNRPDNLFSKFCNDFMKPGEEYPIYFVVRDSQREAYMNAPYIQGREYMRVISFPDEEIDNIGKTRAKIVSYFQNKVDNIIMFDDDVLDGSFTVPSYKADGVDVKSKLLTLRSSQSKKAEESPFFKPTSFGRMLAMWQVMHEIAVEKYNIGLSTCLSAGFAYMPDYCLQKSSIRLYSGCFAAFVALNLKLIKEHDINYRTILGNGHEDIDFQIRCLEDKIPMCEFRWLQFAFDGTVSTEMGRTYTDGKERYKVQAEELQNNFSHLPYLKYMCRRGVYNVRVNWNKYIETQLDIDKNNFQREIDGYTLFLNKYN